MYKSRFPGSLILFGEHAVLHGGQSIVAAVNKYINVTLIPREDNEILICSELLGNYRTSIDNLTIEKPFDFVLEAISTRIAELVSGFELHIYSEFSAELGFGSSAAVTVATLDVLQKWLVGKASDKKKLFIAGINVIRKVQKMGSGADVAATVYGGVISYCAAPLEIKQLTSSLSLPFVVIYSGAKVSTREVVSKVSFMENKHSDIYKNIYQLISKCAADAIPAIINKNWRSVGELMNIQQGLLDALGVNTALLSEIVFGLRKDPGIYGAKISGAGLGDCVIAIGKVMENVFPQNERQKNCGVKRIEL